MKGIEALQKTITESRYLVCLQGKRTAEYCGCTSYLDDEDAYIIESKYGYSPEEMFNGSFYNTRIEEFYQYYKNDVIGQLGEPEEGLKKLAALEENNKLKMVITREIFSLARRAGCKRVLELHGSVYQNLCPHCHESFSIDFIQNAKGVPVCPKCAVPIRPKVCLVGEMLDNAVVTRAAEEVGNADTLLILGCTMGDYLPTTLMRYFSGNKVVLINEKEHYLDSRADIIIHENPLDILARLEV